MNRQEEQRTLRIAIADLQAVADAQDIPKWAVPVLERVARNLGAVLNNSKEKENDNEKAA
jgi:hypothetical protein